MNSPTHDSIMSYLYDRFEWVNLSKLHRETRIDMTRLKRCLEDLESQNLIERKWSYEHCYRITDSAYFKMI